MQQARLIGEAGWSWRTARSPGRARGPGDRLDGDHPAIDGIDRVDWCPTSRRSGRRTARVAADPRSGPIAWSSPRSTRGSDEGHPGRVFDRILIVEDARHRPRGSPCWVEASSWWSRRRLTAVTSDAGRLHPAPRGRPRVLGTALLVARDAGPVFDGHVPRGGRDRAGLRGRRSWRDAAHDNTKRLGGRRRHRELLFTTWARTRRPSWAADLVGRPRPRDYRVVPRFTYTEPGSARSPDEQQAATPPRGRRGPLGLLRLDAAFLEGERRLREDLSPTPARGGPGRARGRRNAASSSTRSADDCRERRPDVGARMSHANPTWSQTVRSAWSQIARP